MNRILGVDQCGAVNSAKQPKPMKAVLFERKKMLWQFSAIELKSLSRESLLRLNVDAIVLDSVIGLPHDVWPIKKKSAGGVWNLFQKAAEAPAYGRVAGENFFKSFLKEKMDTPSRVCEKIANANSIFTTRPFQKNIQTGSFRSWRDLGKEKKFLNLWPFETRSSFNSSKPWIFEGYPSWVWKHLLETTKRSSENLKKIIATKSKVQIKPAKPNQWSLIERNQDSADAFVLGFLLIHMLHGKSLELFPKLPVFVLEYEGWILGVKTRA